MNLGLAEITLLIIGVLLVLALTLGILTRLVAPGRPLAVQRARSRSTLRSTAAVVCGLLAFALAIALHMLNPEWQGVPFVIGPLAAAAVGLTVFAALPAPTIEGAVRRRGAELEQRNVATFSTARQRIIVTSLFGVTVVTVLASGLTSRNATDGRSLCTAFFESVCTAGGPYLYPGWMFALPALTLIVALSAATVVTLHRIVSSPAAAWTELASEDRAQRTAAVRLVMRISSIALILTVGFFLGAAGIPLLNAEVLETGLSPSDDALARTVGLVLVSIGALSLLVGLALAIVTLVGLGRPPRLGADGSIRFQVS